jgi:hypothetical protein
MEELVNDGEHYYHMAFPAEEVEIVRRVPGVRGSSFPSKEVRDTVAVTWCRQTYSRLEIRVNGKRVSERSTYHDFYGIGRSVDSAAEHFDDLVEVLGLKQGDCATVEIHSWIVDVPTFGLKKTEYGRNYYHDIPSDQGPLFVEVPPEGLDAIPLGDKKVLKAVSHSPALVRSSAWSAEENAAAAAAFQTRVNESSRTVGALI